MAKTTKKPVKKVAKTTTKKTVTKKTQQNEELPAENLVLQDVNEDSNDAQLVKTEAKVEKVTEEKQEVKKNKNFFAKMKNIIWF